MKRIYRCLALMLAVMMLLSATVFATGTESDKATLTVVEGAGVTAEFDSTNPDIIHVSVAGSLLEEGRQYVVLMIKCSDGENYTIDSNSILYIDQKAAEADGTISFDVYPSSIQSSVILIAGADDGLIKAVIVKGKYVLGDVNSSSSIDATDALQVLRYAARLAELSPTAMLAADVNGSGTVDSTDALLILRYRAGLISKFPAEE